MHVCFLSTYFPQPCGIASYVHYLTQALLTVEPTFRTTILAEVPAHEIVQSSLQVTGTFLRTDDYPEQIIKKLTPTAPHVVHIQHEYGVFGYDDRFLKLLRQLQHMGIKTVVTMHTVHTNLSFFAGCAAPHLRHMLRRINIEEYQRQIAHFVDLIIVHQDVPIRQVLLRQGVPAEKVIAIPHGTRLSEPTDEARAKAAFGIESDSPLLVAFGYLEESKNLHLLIDAFQRVKKRIPKAKLWLSGYIRVPVSKTLSYKDRCIKRIDRYALQDDVIFSETMLPEHDLPLLLSAADVACLVYKEDTYSSSGALHLALGLHRPVVASRISKFHELTQVSDEILVNPNSAGELSRVLIRLLSDQPFRQHVQQRIADFAAETAWPRIAEMHLAVYQKLISDPMPVVSHHWVPTETELVSG